MNPKKLTGLITALSFALMGMVATATAGNTTPATATFVGVTGTPAGQTIYADSYGPYKDGLYSDTSAMVTGISQVSSNSYFFRTVSSSGQTTGTNLRSVNLTFTGSVPAGLTSGTNMVGDLRILASSLFSAFPRGATSTTTPVSMPFSLSQDFVGTSDFQLDFDSPVTVTGTTPSRTMTATNATATLTDLRGKKAVVVGKYTMSFSLTVTKN
jgi:hypothetical protein